jgi:hypothetical protein
VQLPKRAAVTRDRALLALAKRHGLDAPALEVLLAQNRDLWRLNRALTAVLASLDDLDRQRLEAALHANLSDTLVALP